MPNKPNLPKLDKTKILKTGELEGVMERVFDAPPERVYAVHTDPDAIPGWWGPAYLKTRVDRLDVRVGGGWRFVQHDEDGNEHAFHGEYREVVPNRRLVMTFVYEPYPDKEILETYTFEPIHGGRTLLRVVSRFPDQETLDGMTAAGMEEGARETWERLSRLVAVRQAIAGEPGEILTLRTIDAAPADVFAAFTDIEHVSDWWGPRGFRTTTKSHDLRAGGHWEHVMHGPDGTDHPNFIRFTVVAPPRRLAWEHGETPDGPVWFRVEVEFEAAGEQTLVRMRHQFPSEQKRNENIAKYGAAEGAYDTLARLAEIVEGRP